MLLYHLLLLVYINREKITYCSQLQMTSGENIYLYIYINMYIYSVPLYAKRNHWANCDTKKSKTFAIGWVRGFSFQLPETTRKKIYQSHETLGSYSNSARPDSCKKGWRVHGILRHTLQVPTLLFFFPLQSWLGFC